MKTTTAKTRKKWWSSPPGRRLPPRLRALLIGWSFLALAATSANAEDGSEPDSVRALPEVRALLASDEPSSSTPADTTNLSSYLNQLSRQNESRFDLEALHVTDAEIDSLMRIYEETGIEPGLAEGSPRRGLDFRFGLDGIRFSRVEGLHPRARAGLSFRRFPPLQFFGRVGYPIALEETMWTGGINWSFAKAPLRPTLQIRAGRNVVAYGSGGVPGNSFVALVFGKDYEDYFRTEERSATLITYPGPFRFDVRYAREEQSSIANETDFSLSGDADYRPNPAIEAGEVRLLEVGIELHAQNRSEQATRLRVAGQAAGGGFGGDFEYERYHGEVSHRRSLWFGDEVRASISGGGVTGDAPFQALHHLGGFDTLRGYEINELGAREYVHARIDYALGTNLLRVIPKLRMAKLQLVPFVDAAAIFESEDSSGNRVRHDDPDVRYSAGVGLQNNLLGIPGGAGQLRLDVAKRLDRDEDTMTYRLSVTVQR